MGHIFKIYFIISILIILTNCTEKTLYSGKIFNSSEIEYNNLKDINELTNTLGDPNFIDPIEKKYYYFSEKKKVKNFFNKKIMDRTILVFVFDAKYEPVTISETWVKSLLRLPGLVTVNGLSFIYWYSNMPITAASL